MMDSSVIAGWVLIGMLWGLLVPYVGYWCYIYIYYKRNKLYFKKRKPLLIDILVALVVSGILIENQTLIFLSIFGLDGDGVILAECVRFFNISTLMAVYMVVMIRIYLLYFQANYNEATISKKWREFVHEEQEDFFLSNIHTYGNDKFLIRLASIVWLCLCAIYIVLESFLPATSISQWFIFVLFIALLMFAAYMLRKFPDFHDTLHIRTELQYFVALNFMILLAWTVLLAIGQGVSGGIARYYWQVTMYLVIFWISIVRVVHWNEIKKMADPKDKNSVYYLAMTDRAFNIHHVLATQKGYEEFMKFLVSEFSTENLLFLTEYIQLKNLLCLSEKEMRSLKVTLNVELPDTLPMPKMIQDLNLNIEQIRHVQRERKEKLKLRKKRLEKLHAAETARESTSRNDTQNLDQSQQDQPRSPTVEEEEDEDDDDLDAAATRTTRIHAGTLPTQSTIADSYDDTKSPGVFSHSLVSTTVTALHPNTSASADVTDLYGNVIEEEEQDEEQELPPILDVQSAPVTTAYLETHTRKDSWANVVSQTREDQDQGDEDDDDGEKSENVGEDAKTEDKDKDDGNEHDAGSTNNTTAIHKLWPSQPSAVNTNMKEDIKHRYMVSASAGVSTTAKFAKDDIAVSGSTVNASLDIDALTSASPKLIVGARSLTLQRTVNKTKKSKSNMRLQIIKKSKTMAAEVRYQIREASNSIGLKKKNRASNVLDCKAFSNICIKIYFKYIATSVAPLEINISSATRARCVHIFQANILARQSSVSRSTTGSTRPRGYSGNALSKGVADMLTSKRDAMMRMDALEVLREGGTLKEGTTFSSKSNRKLQLNNTEEPFDGNIVVAMGELLPPLEQCAAEITNLLKDSFQRFRKTKTCCKLYAEYASTIRL